MCGVSPREVDTRDEHICVPMQCLNTEWPKLGSAYASQTAESKLDVRDVGQSLNCQIIGDGECLNKTA